MKPPRFFRFHLTITFSGLLIILIPRLLFAETITVPTDFSTIQEAIDEADLDDVIHVQSRAEPYEEDIVLKDRITLEGDETAETARTIIDGTRSGAVITAGNNTTIRKLTITGGITGVAATNLNNVNIENNIIVGNDTGISCQNSDVTINQNTINNNGVSGISCSGAQAAVITNNLITNNGEGINLGTNTTLPSNNGFFANSNGNGAEGTDPVKEEDPLYVNTIENDYHLQSDSPYRGDDLTILGDDLGVYGGSTADLTPFRILGLTVTPGTTTFDISWSPNLAYNISGYNVYVEKIKGTRETPAQVPTCVINQCMFTTPVLDNTAAPPDKPTLHPPLTGDQQLFLSWNPPVDQTNISSYEVSWGTASGNYDAPGSPMDVGNVTELTLSGLTNNLSYFIVVKAIARPRFFVSVTAIDNASSPNESSFFEEKETSLTSGTAAKSVSSNEVREFPEVVVGFPNLPDEGGCFIATAAYGSPLAPHVQILRDFRDRYLLPTTLGKRFVAIYYQHGRPLANFIQRHESLKSLVRILLLPLIGLSYFLLSTTIVQKAGVFLALALLVIFIMRFRYRHSGSATP